MTFTTLTFLLFTAICFGVYWGLGRWRLQNAFLVVASYVFYGWWDWRFCGLIAASTAIDYWVALRMEDRGRSKALLGISVAANLGMLGAFKYYDFFVQSLISATSSLGLSLHVETLNLILPVGISFYTFQTLGTTIDVYRRQLSACRDPVAYAAYVSFFPQLVAGPIERGAALLPQFLRPRVFDPAAARAGLRQALWGFFQKAVLADNLAPLVDGCYEGSCPGPMLLASTVAFAFQIYWDFAGYSNIAVGVAKLFGFSLRRNFARPYFSRSVAEFWRRWHISLSTWFRDYVYTPLGGNRRGRARQMFAVVVTFVVSGLWHGASWTFVAWGALHGLAALPSVLGGRDRRGRSPRFDHTGLVPPLRDVVHMLGTFLIVCLGWVFFRAHDVGHALSILATIGADVFDTRTWSAAAVGTDYLQGMAALVGIAVLLEWVFRDRDHVLEDIPWPRLARWLLYSALVWCTLYLMPEEPVGFVYFQF